MSFIVLANFKSHKSEAEVTSWLQALAPHSLNYQDKISTLVAPSYVHLPRVASFITHDSLPIRLCAQDASPYPPGAYTGAVNAAQLKEYKVSYCLIGHSERRRYFHETPTDVANKVRELLSVGITPIICLAKEDIAPQFAALNDELQTSCIYCFEPPGDIGGTVTAPLDVITDTINQIKKYITAPILYGGSVTEDNFASLFSTPIDGVLVATASLDSQSFISILKQAHTHAR